MKAQKVVLLVAGVFVALIGLGLLTVGGSLLWLDQTHRDVDGYLTSPTYDLSSGGYAVILEDIDMTARAGRGDWLPTLGEWGPACG